MLDTKKLLLEFSALTGVSGHEDVAVRYAENLLNKFGRTFITPLGSVVCNVIPPKEGGAHILLDAHIDEVGMIVTQISDNGFVKVQNCGGMDNRILMAARVLLHGAERSITGIVCSTPPHLSSGDTKNKKVEELYIDTGFSKEEAEKILQPGDRVTVAASSMPLLGELVSGRALDDRAGCAALIKTLEYLAGRSPDCGLSVVFSSMEEVGCMGAKTAAYIVNPTHCIAVDVSFAHTPDSVREKCGDLGKGPMIGYSPLLSKEMSRRFAALAKENGIPFQSEVMGGRTSTNIDSIVTSRHGIICGLLSVPLKYMHTPIETVSIEDVENTAKLIAAYVSSFKEAKV